MNYTKIRLSCSLFILLAVFITLVPRPLPAAETIIWLNDNLPPAFISEGPGKGEGIVDGVVSIYKKHLPEYEHRHVVANMARIISMMKQGENACYAGFFKTPEREEFVHFSLPNLIALSNSLVIERSGAEKMFGNRSSISLEEMLKKENLKPGITKDRSYGEVIDSLLNRYRDNNNKYTVRAGENSLLGLLQMLENKRIDYTIGFPWEVSYIADRLGKRNKFSVFPIEETKDSQWTRNYIGCTKNSWGEVVIEKINAILLKVRSTEEHMHHQLKWFPGNLEGVVRNAYKDLILMPARDSGARRIVTVAIANWPPWKIIEKGRFSGIDIDILKALEARTNSIKFSFIECPWKRCVEMIKEGDVDLITSFSRRAKRERFTYYIEPPYVLERTITFYVRKDEGPVIKEYYDLRNHVVGKVKSSASFKRFDNDPEIDKFEVTWEDQLLKMLDSKRLDVIVGHDLVFDYLIAKEGFTGKFEKSPFKFTKRTGAYLAMSKKSDSLDTIPLISDTLAQMVKSGEINTIRDAFLNKLQKIKR